MWKMTNQNYIPTKNLTEIIQKMLGVFCPNNLYYIGHNYYISLYIDLFDWWVNTSLADDMKSSTYVVWNGC